MVSCAQEDLGTVRIAFTSSRVAKEASAAYRQAWTDMAIGRLTDAMNLNAKNAFYRATLFCNIEKFSLFYIYN